MNLSFDSPAVLWLLVLVPAVVALRRLRRSELPLPQAGRLPSFTVSWRQMLFPIIRLLPVVAAVLIVVAAAGPKKGLTRRISTAEGITILLVVDQSGSMTRDDFGQSDRPITRLQAVKEVATRFIQGDEILPGRPQDQIGLVTFAGVPRLESPPTLDHQFVLARLEELEATGNFRDDGTAIGDALGLAVAHLVETKSGLADSPSVRSDDTAGPEQVVILLTDGEQNAGVLSPAEAGELALRYDIRVYVIDVSDADTANPSGKMNPVARLAELTGGAQFVAGDPVALREVYRMIDDIETTEFRGRPYVDYRHAAIESFPSGPFLVPPLAAVALACLAIAFVFDAAVLRTLP